jgi:hypothetical protein
MRKYKSQTFVSVVGLAVGFACFAIATLWIRYEMTYDSFHKNAARIYCVYTPHPFSPNGISRIGVYPMAVSLRGIFPEIVNSIPVQSSHSDFELEGLKYDANMLQVDSSFFSMFDVRIVEGNMDFLIPENK